MNRIVGTLSRAAASTLIVASAWAVLAAGCAPPPGKAPAPEKVTTPAPVEVKAPAPAPIGATADFQAMIYQLMMPAARLGDLNADALADQTAGPADFARSLARFGSAKVLYRVDQAVNLSDDRITIGTRVPIVTAARVASGGERTSTITYQDVGAIFRISAGPADGQSDSRRVKLTVELSVIDPGEVEISPSVKAPVYRKATLAHDGALRSGRAIVMISADATGGSAGESVVFICRAVFGEKQP